MWGCHFGGDNIPINKTLPEGMWYDGRKWGDVVELWVEVGAGSQLGGRCQGGPFPGGDIGVETQIFPDLGAEPPGRANSTCRGPEVGS